MKGFLTLCLLFVASAAFAQKVEVKDDAVLVDGGKYALVEQDGCKLMDTQCIYYLKSLDGKRQLAVKQLEFVDPATMSASHPDGRTLFVLCAAGTHEADVAGKGEGAIYTMTVEHPHAGRP